MHINGIRRHDRIQWTTSRWHAWIIARLLGSNINIPSDLAKFPWENTAEEIDEEEEEKKLKELLDLCKKENIV